MKTTMLANALVFFAGLTPALAQTITHTAKGFHHIESISTDGRYLYAADIGKELNPAAKDGDGRILKLDMKGNIIDSAFSRETLNAPKGIVAADSLLFAADVDRLVALDLKTGRKRYEIVFPGVSFLNDIAVADKRTLYISSTDQGKIYKVSLAERTYTELVTDQTVPGTNGLFYDKKTNRLYVNGMGSGEKTGGMAGYIDLSTNKFTRLGTAEGIFDGVWLKNGKLYISNWVAFEKKGIIQAVELKSGSTATLALSEPVAGPADFIIVRNRLILPEMISGTILFIRLR